MTGKCPGRAGGRVAGVNRALMPQLYDHLFCEGLEFSEWAIQWLRFLLAEELPVESVCRLWDAYFALDDPQVRRLLWLQRQTAVCFWQETAGRTRGENSSRQQEG